MKIIVLLLLTLTFFACGDNVSLTRTPKGVNIIGTVNQQEAKTIDASLDNLFSDAKKDGYTQKLEHSVYTFWVKDDCVDVNGVKSFVVNDSSNSYDGTIFDRSGNEPQTDSNLIAQGIVYLQDGVTVITAAEQVNNVGRGSASICRDTLPNMADTTRFAVEHIILAFNDINKYNETMVHRTSGHPLIQDYE